MPGFLGYISHKEEVLKHPINFQELKSINKNLIEEEMNISTDGLYGKIFRNSVKKFKKDKAFSQSFTSCFVLDGVILNKQRLYKKYNVDDNKMETLIETMDYLNPSSFFSEFRGTFAGVSLNKKKDVFRLYTNHIGDKEVFYHLDEKNDTLYFGTDFYSLIVLIQKHCNKKFDINTNGAYSLLSHGHTLCNETLFEKIYRLSPGHYLMYSSNGLEKHIYYEIKNKSIEISEPEALKQLNNHFVNAVKSSFDKDLEYGYKHLVALSGGLDSRMTTWVAHTLGYDNVVNYTFSQTNYYDEKIPKKISNQLENEWLFKALDNGVYLYNYFDDSLKISGARSYNATISHTMSMLNNLNMENFGLVHTGQLGDVILGTYYENGKKESFRRGAGAVSSMLINEVYYSEENAVHIDDLELFKFYNRGFTGINVGLKPMYEYTETISPFLDIDFMEFCLSLPFEYRKNHYLYIKWINEFYPEAAEFIYEKVRGKIKHKIIPIKGVPIPWTSIPSAVLKVTKKKLNMQLNSSSHMNPLDYWYKKNKNLREFYQTQFSENIEFIKEESLRENCEKLFKTGSGTEKNQVITFLGFLKLMDTSIN
ncbi:hypothetical protein [Enterococcus gilvus]|uniref:hypothetical protein n=1 Tax=Enterococcus gilvus TaxID=160453 RepID=UPI0028D27D5E|nr:hypothetical protein [Enterococcus gilvus]